MSDKLQGSGWKYTCCQIADAARREGYEYGLQKAAARIAELEAEAARATTVTEGMEMVNRSYLRGLETEWAGAAAKIAELEAALLPLATAADEFPDDAPERIYLWRVEPSLWVDPDHREPKQITLKDARNARAVLRARPAP